MIMIKNKGLTASTSEIYLDYFTQILIWVAYDIM